MATLPADNYIPDAARTEGEQKVALEALRDVLAQMIGGGGGAIEDLTISGGVITPSQGFISVDTEGGTSSDDLVTIQTTNLPNGSLLLMSSFTNTRNVVVKTTGNIVSPWGEFTLTSWNDKALLYRQGSDWYVIHVFRNTKASQRNDLGLGDAAVMDQGPGNGLNSDLLDGQHAAAFLGVSAKAADSELLDGIDGSAYARKDVGTSQDFSGAIQATTIVRVNDPATSTPQFELRDNGVRRGLLMFDGTNVVLRLYQSNGTTIDGVIRIAPSSNCPQWSPDGSTWYPIWNGQLMGAASGLDADTLDSHHYATFDLHASQMSFGAGSASSSSPGTISLNANSLFPSVTMTGGTPWIMKTSYHATGGSETAPTFRLEDGNGTWTVKWRYISP